MNFAYNIALVLIYKVKYISKFVVYKHSVLKDLITCYQFVRRGSFRL